MIGKVVKTKDFSGKVVATLENAVFIEVADNLFKVVHPDEILGEADPVVIMKDAVTGEPVEVPAKAAEAIAEAAKVVKKPRKKKAPKAE